MYDNTTEIIEVRLIAETERAILVDYDGDEQWLPSSQVEFLDLNYEKGKTMEIEVPRWLMIKKKWSEDDE